MGVRAGAVVGPLAGAIGLMATLDPIVAIAAAAGGAVASGLLFGLSDHLSRRASRR